MSTGQSGGAGKALRWQLLAGTALSMAVVHSGDALAQSTPPAGPVTQMPGVSVESQRPYEQYKVDKVQSFKNPEPVLDTPQTIQVIPKAILEDQNSFTMRDALRNVPGITIGAGEGGGAQGDQIRIRGFNGPNDVFVDGIRDTFSRFATDAFNLEAVEIGKGPSGTYSGRGTTGGYINQVTKTPTLESFYAGTAAFGTDMTRRATMDVNQPFDWANGAFRLNAVVHENEVAERDVTEANRWGIAPSILFGIGTPTRLNLSYFHLTDNRISDYGLATLNGRESPVDRSNWYGFRDLNTDETSTDALTFRFEHDLAENATVRNAFRYAYNERYAIVTPPRNPNPAANTLQRNPTGRDIDASLLLNQTDVQATFSDGPVSFTTINGFEFAREDYDTQSLAFAPAAPLDRLFNPDPDTRYFPAVNKGNLTETLAHNYGLYTLNTIKFYDAFELIGGLRYDRFITGTRVEAATGVETSNVSRTDEEPSWRVGAVYKPMTYGSVYVSYSTSFNPSAEEVALAANQDTTPPETNETYELGTKWELLDRKLLTQAAIFRIHKDNARSGTDPITGDVGSIGEQRVNGFEISATGYLMPNWQIFTGYTFLDSKTLDSATNAERGKRIFNVPTHSFSLWSTYETPWDVQVGFGTQFVGHRHLTAANTGLEADAYWLFELMAAYHVTENIDIRLNVYNLTNEFYIASAHAGGAHYIPGPGRSALISTSFKF